MKNNKGKNKKKDSTFTLLELIVIVFAFSILSGVLTGLIVNKYNSRIIYKDKELSDIVDTYNKVNSGYYEDVDKAKLADSAIDGMMNYLNEKYSTFLDINSANYLNNTLEGSYKGIGILVGKTDAGIEIIKVYVNTPAKKAGLKEGDIIYRVDGVDVTDVDLNDVVEFIQDSEKTNMVVLRDNKKVDIEINVTNIDNPVVDYEIFESNKKKIGYIYLSSFSASSDVQVSSALKELEDEGIDALIFDVRSNTGGYLVNCTNIISKFIKKGKVLYSLEGKNKRTVFYDKTNEERDYPMVVLVNSATASASEILASSLKESYGAVLIGNNTFGKGKVQQTNTLSDDSMIKYTTSHWYTPNGDSIDEIGIKVGINVDLTKEYADNPGYDTDDQLKTAIKYLSEEE